MMKVSYDNGSGELHELFCGKIRCTGIKGLSATIKLSTADNTFADGSEYIGKRSEERNIVLDLAYYDYTYEDARDIIYDIFKTAGEGILILEECERAPRKISCHISGIEMPRDTCTCQISMVCCDPFFESMEGEFFEFGEVETGDFEFPLELPADESFEFSSIECRQGIDIINKSNTAIGCVITLSCKRADKTNVVITNRTTGESFKMISEYTFAENERIIIDSRRGHKDVQKAMPTGNISILGYMDWQSDFITLRPGTNRLFISADGGISGINAKIEYADICEWL